MAREGWSESEREREAGGREGKRERRTDRQRKRDEEWRKKNSG